jgi:Domain of unknown function (DUF4159)
MSSQAWLNLKMKFLRVVPFRGLLVDENTWQDSHEYHRNQMRFHLMALHGVGIVGGLDVVASNPPDMNLTVRPGLAIDSDGRMLLLNEAQTVNVPRQLSMTMMYVSLEYKESPTQMQNVTDGGTPQISRLVEECEVRVSPEASATGVELARINIEPNSRQLRNAANNRQAGNNEIDVSHRLLIGDRSGTGAGGRGRPSITVGLVRHGTATGTEWKLHTEGVRRLLRDTSSLTELDTGLLDGISLTDENQVRNCKLLYITGNNTLRFSPEEENALRRHLDRGGVLWLDAYRFGVPSGAPDEFSRGATELAQRLGRQLQPLRPGHPLLTAQYLFAAPPTALDPSGTVLEGNRLIITTGDYGSLWEGKGQAGTEPPTREVLRAAQEFGANALFLALGKRE